MSKSLNQVYLMGNLTRDPDVRQTPSGQTVTNFSIALNRTYKDNNDQWQEATDFVDIVVWGKKAESAGQYLKRGSRVLVEGRLQSRSYEKDGVKRSVLEVLAAEVTFLDAVESKDA